MNVYDWMGATESEPPLHEDNSREDPSHRPHTPTTDGDDRQHHGDSSPAGGGRSHEESEHHVEHTIQDPEMIADLTASNESIIEDVRKFFKIHNRGKAFEELDGNARASAAKIYKAIENTFASKEWVDKQTPITGKIKVGDLADRLNINDPVGTVKETFAINESFQEAIIAAQMPLVKELAQVTEKWNPNKLTDQNYEQLRDHLTTMKTMQELVKKPTRSKTSLLDGKNKVDVAPSLNPEETLELGTTILTSMKKDHSRIVATNEEIHRLLDNIWEANHQIERQDGQSPGYNVEAWTKLMDTAFRKIPGSTPESLAAFRQFEDACVAAVIYMERSFKGGKGEVVSNEGIVDTIRKVFDPNKDGKIYDKAESGFLYELEKELKDKYANAGWVKRRGVKEGKITVNGLNLLGKEGDKVVADYIAKTETRRKEKHKVLVPVLDKLEEIVKALDSGAGKDASKMKELNDKLNSVRKYTISKYEFDRTKPREGQIDALTELEVNQLGKQMADLFTKMKADTTLIDRMNGFIQGGASGYRNWKYVETSSYKTLMSQLTASGFKDGEKFLANYESLVEDLIDDVRMGGELQGIKAHLMARFQLLERSVK